MGGEEYASFCRRVRETREWKEGGATLRLGEQSRLLGAMYRSSIPPLVTKKGEARKRKASKWDLVDKKKGKGKSARVEKGCDVAKREEECDPNSCVWEEEEGKCYEGWVAVRGGGFKEGGGHRERREKERKGDEAFQRGVDAETILELWKRLQKNTRCEVDVYSPLRRDAEYVAKIMGDKRVTKMSDYGKKWASQKDRKATIHVSLDPAINWNPDFIYMVSNANYGKNVKAKVDFEFEE